MINKYFIFFLLLVITSCNKYSDKNSNTKLEEVLNQAGDNSEELEKVLIFYKKNPVDSLKYKAAVFLIENMKGHMSYKPLVEFEDVFDSISRLPDDDSRFNTINNIILSVSKNRSIPKTTSPIPDNSFVTSKLLINNIELAFKAWNKITENKRGSFEDFCNYILPYKSNFQPIELDDREKLSKKYSWIYNKLNNGDSLQSIVNTVISDFNCKVNLNIGKFYPQPLSINQIQKSRIGSCSDAANYLVSVFRSVGLISSKERIPHWGNHHSMGHFWFFVKYGNEEYSADLYSHVDLKNSYKEESIPKVYREVYNTQEELVSFPFTEDVTNKYVNTVNIKIPNILQATEYQPVLCVFDTYNEWSVVSQGKLKGSSNIYTNVGVNVLYGSQYKRQYNPSN